MKSQFDFIFTWRTLVLCLGVMLLAACSSKTPQTAGQPTESVEELSNRLISLMNAASSKNTTNAAAQEIVKEFAYKLTPEDSRNTARRKASHQVRLRILQEVNQLTEEYLALDVHLADKKELALVKQEVKQLTAKTTSMQLVEERFNGTIYYLKARTVLDPSSLAEGLSEAVKITANREEAKKLKELVQTRSSTADTRSKEVISLQKKLAAQELLSQARAKELAAAQQKLAQLEAEETSVMARLQQIHTDINSKSVYASKNITRGMTYSEMVSVAGEPKSTAKGILYGSIYNYGKVWAHIEHGVVACLTEVKHQCIHNEACHLYTHPNKHYPNYKGCVVK